MRLSQAVQAYLLARRSDWAPVTRRNLRRDLTRTANDIGPDILVRMVKRKHVEGWLSGLTSSPATIRVRLSTFRQFCRWCLLHGYMKNDPTLGIRGPRQPRPMPRELSHEEVEKLLCSLPDARAEVIVMLGLVQGLRRSSISAQLREDIDLTGRMMLVTWTKNNAQLWLPLLEDTAQAIEAYYRELPGNTGPLVRSQSHPERGIAPFTIGELIAGWMRDAGVKLHAGDGRSAHALRHTRAGTMLDDGADIREVQAALGHESLGSTYIYLRRRHADSALRDAMGRRRYRDAS
jgi:site-specific recombinase XerD